MFNLSIVVPCFNEQEVLKIFYEKILEILKLSENEINFELIFVNDGSTDKTLNLIKQLAVNDSRVKYVSFSRNFGKESAIYAGLEKSNKDFVAIMDADLQDPPSLILEMIKSITNEKLDCVCARRKTRKGESKLRSLFAIMFYKMINIISKTKIVEGARDYRMMTRQMVNAVLDLKEYNRFSKGIFSWVGFKTKWIEYENIERVAGETKWSFWKLILYSFEGIIAFSTVPLAIASFLGVIMFLVSCIFILIIVFKTLVFGESVSGYPSLICTITLIGGIQLLCTGILGQYLSKTYLETKKRPIYIIKEESREERFDDK